MTQPKIGVIGAGQLGRMLALAGYPLGVRCLFLDREPDAPGAQVSEILLADYDDQRALLQLARAVDVVTVDIENVGLHGLQALADIAPLYPPPAAIGTAQDRLAEKQLFQSLGIPTVRHAIIDSEDDLRRAGALGWPQVVKARRLGYDGRGQRVVHNADELTSAWQSLGRVPAICEAWVAFEREVSLIGVFGANGEQAYYPLSENVHRDGQLHCTVAPYPSARLQSLAERWLAAIAHRLNYRGVLTVEFFITGDSLIANEMAPRVHNSGHWTIEGAETSQFENHLRAILGWPLGSTMPHGHAAMLNLIGRLPPRPAVLELTGVHLHDYGKEPRAARKLGHCTIVDNDRERLLDRLKTLEDRLGNAAV